MSRVRKSPRSTAALNTGSPPSRLSDIETKGIVPSIYRFYSLSVIHRKDIRILLSWFGVELDGMAKDISVFTPPHSHYLTALTDRQSIKIPMQFDVAPDDRSTGNLGRMVEKWGVVPFTYLEQFVSDEYSYAFIGTEDLTMYPLLLPGTFLQVDESKTNVARGMEILNMGGQSTLSKHAKVTCAAGVLSIIGR